MVDGLLDDVEVSGFFVSEVSVGVLVESKERVNIEEDDDEGFDSVGPFLNIILLLLHKYLEDHDVGKTTHAEDEDVGAVASGELDVDLVSGHDVSDNDLGEGLEADDVHPHEDGNDVVPPVLLPRLVDPVEDEVPDGADEVQEEVEEDHEHFGVEATHGALKLSIDPAPEESTDEDAGVGEDEGRGPLGLEESVHVHEEVEHGEGKPGHEEESDEVGLLVDPLISLAD